MNACIRRLTPVVVLFIHGEAIAQSTRVQDADRFELWVQGETYAALFRRSLMPGGRGALAIRETVVPVRQDLRLSVRDLDVPWRRDSIDVELSLWGLLSPGEPIQERSVDGDVQTAHVTYRHGPLTLRLGRQIASGGAARYARFDGATVSAELGAGFGAEAYGGFSVLPRWDQQPGYYYLGSAADSNLRDPSALPNTDRGGYYLGGGRLRYRHERFTAGLSAHEQHESRGVARRNLAADGTVHVSEATSATALALFDIDSRRFADARAWLDTTPWKPLDISFEYAHTEPALLLSRQSVLSVFSTAAYEDAGARATLRASRTFEFEGASSVQFYDVGHAGVRNEVAARIAPLSDRSTWIRVGYTRLLSPDNGYHALRMSLARRFVPRLLGTVEGYGYFYDEAIRSVRTSMVYAGTLTWQALTALDIMLGGSLARSPYALADTQVQLRLAYAFDVIRSGKTW